nr:hypothetical protein [Micromonospora sp. DSM 115978]
VVEPPSATPSASATTAATNRVQARSAPHHAHHDHTDNDHNRGDQTHGDGTRSDYPRSHSHGDVVDAELYAGPEAAEHATAAYRPLSRDDDIIDAEVVEE